MRIAWGQRFAPQVALAIFWIVLPATQIREGEIAPLWYAIAGLGLLSCGISVFNEVRRTPAPTQSVHRQISILGWLMRHVLIFACSAYFLLSVTYVPLLLTQLNLPAALWWVVYVLAEMLLLGGPLAFALWRYLWRPTISQKATVRPGHVNRFFSVVCMILVPIFALFVVPAGLLASLPNRLGTVAAGICVGTTLVLLVASWAYSRYYWMPRHPEVRAKVRSHAADSGGA